MNVFHTDPPAASAAVLESEGQRFYSQAAAACLARLQRTVDLLQQPCLPEINQAGLFDEIAVQTERLNTLLRHVLTAGGEDASARAQPAALLPVLAALVSDYQALGAGHQFSLRLAALPAVAAQAVPCVRLALQLLLDNALRRSPAGATVSVAAEAGPNDDGWHFHVSDQGIRLAPAQLAGVFDNPSLAGSTGAYGLGISLVRYIVEALGGRVWAGGQSEQGTTFSFSLPRRILPRRWTVTRPRVLLIEAEPALCAALREGYEAAGFEVEAAASPEAGLALAPAFAPNLVLLELAPGALNVPATVAALRRCSNAAVVFLVAAEQRAALPDALWQGATDCLVKPFHIRELIARTRAILRRRLPAAKAETSRPARFFPSLLQRPNTNPLLQ